MGKLKNALLNGKLMWYSLFHGMEAGNALLEQRENSTDADSDVIARKEQDSVFKDFINGEETQRVKETRDEMYKVLQASEDIIVEHTKLSDGSGAVLKARKKTPADYIFKINVFNPENLSIRIIQEAKSYIVGSSLFADELDKKPINIFKIERDFLPRFKLEDYANKLVVRTIDEKNVYIDFYTTEYASQFGKIDALFIKQLYDIKKTNNKKSDITSFDNLSFISDKSAGEHSLCEFSYKNISFQTINLYDGNYVLTFKGEVDIDGKFVGDKFKTESLEKKLKEKAVRDGITVDADTIMRREEQEKNNKKPDYGSITFTLTDEKDSD